MYPVVLSTFYHALIKPSQLPQGVVTHIMLNYYEYECIELALIGLNEHLQNKTLPKTLKGYRVNDLSAQLRYLKHWLNQPGLKSRLRSDAEKSILWPFTSTERVDWLLRICESCISKDAILIAAANAASHQFAEFEESCVENVDSYLLASCLSYRWLSYFQHYYNEVMRMYQTLLVNKLAAIKAQDYPLLPEFGALH